MSVQGATIKRLEFLTSRWEYDIPHKFIWVVDMYGVTTSNLNNVLNQYERKNYREWPVKEQVSLDAIRSQYGFNGLAQSIAFPQVAMQIQVPEIENRGGLTPGLAGSTRYPFGAENKIDITFLETNIDTVDYFIKPWIIATAHKGLIEDGDRSTNVKCTIDAYLYGRAVNRSGVPTLRKHITFYKCSPIYAKPDELSYGDLSISDITTPVSFVYERFTINSIDAARIQTVQPILRATPAITVIPTK